MSELRSKLVTSAFKLALISSLAATPGWSFEPNLPTVSLPDISNYLAQGTVDAFIKTIGFGLDHRPYEPATSLGASFDFGVEATLMQPPSNLGSSVANIGSPPGTSISNTSTSSIPFIPSLKVHLRKGLGEKLDIGASFLYVPTTVPYAGGTLLFGGDLKYVFFRPEEGLTAALRASYTFTNLSLTYTGYALTSKTVTITPQLIVSRKVGFAEPYAGVGFQYTYGTILATVPVPEIDLVPGIVIAPISMTVNGGGTGVSFFGGLSLVSIIRFRITIEGGYNPDGENYLGTKIGFTL